MIELAKTYDPKIAEADAYARWEAQGCFAPEINHDPNAPVYSIVIPPPNVTGNLHMGHALQHTIMDVLTRWKRMCGYRTLWLPGTDHAGISTQLMVTRQLEKEGLSRFDLGREKFIERVWQWKREYGGQITQQMRREGTSVDWSRERFTMDEGLSNAVREAFVRLYEEGHIYRGHRIVNWCPKDQTVLSDLEVDKESFKGKLYFLQYPIKNSDERITVATTRPETMLGDTAVAVNPNDERYKSLIGAKINLPLVEREIPVIADEYVDPQFGTGAVKVTPAHDPNDYEMGLRHNLPQIVVMDKHARMTEAAGAEFQGLDRYAARERVIERFEQLGLLAKTEDYEFAISRCNRCRTVIEPLISLQWFCRMEEMRDLALRLMREKHLPRFTPSGYEKVYTEWLENLRDWTISRQLWWGHQIPAWYDAEGNVYVARNEQEARAKARAAGVADDEKLTQDPDVLDTWFSSALWPFSTLGWCNASSDETTTRDLETFYPTSVLVTARDIIFLWVSRMVMTGMKFIGATPFRDVFVTGTIFDKHGQRMSKTKGNGVDPLDVFDKYGVDATRLVLAAIGSTDTRWSDNQVESYRNFANKIWNAARFCLLNSEGAQILADADLTHKNLALHDRWILSRLNSTARRVNSAFELYDFHDAVQTLYHFFWDDFCDWYIELAKAEVTTDEATPERAAARSRLLTVLERALRLLHPFMPFITEELWRNLPQMRERGAQFFHAAYAQADVEPTVMLTAFPQGDASLIDERAEREMNAVIELIARVRNIRAEMNIKPSEQVRVIVSASDADLRQIFETNRAAIARLARASEIRIGESLETPRASARAALTGGAGIAVPLEGLIDFARERERITRELEKLKKEAERLEAQLSNANFIERAPAEKITEARARLADIAQRAKVLAQTLENLE
jgi:valyl-tRNA synthetase